MYITVQSSQWYVRYVKFGVVYFESVTEGRKLNWKWKWNCPIEKRKGGWQKKRKAKKTGGGKREDERRVERDMTFPDLTTSCSLSPHSMQYTAIGILLLPVFIPQTRYNIWYVVLLYWRHQSTPTCDTASFTKTFNFQLQLQLQFSTSTSSRVLPRPSVPPFPVNFNLASSSPSLISSYIVLSNLVLSYFVLSYLIASTLLPTGSLLFISLYFISFLALKVVDAIFKLMHCIDTFRMWRDDAHSI